MVQTESSKVDQTMTCPVCYGEAINVQGVSDCRNCNWTGRRRDR